MRLESKRCAGAGMPENLPVGRVCLAQFLISRIEN
jgi:hypothetical protein